MTRWFVHLAAEDEFDAEARAEQYGRVVALETEPAPDGRRVYGTAEIVPHTKGEPCE